MLEPDVPVEPRMVGVGHVAGGEHVRVGGLQLRVNEDPVFDGQTGLLGEFEVGPDPDADDDDVRGQLIAGCCSQLLLGPADRLPGGFPQSLALGRVKLPTPDGSLARGLPGGGPLAAPAGLHLGNVRSAASLPTPNHTGSTPAASTPVARKATA